VDVVPDDVPVGLHLCYGDYGHQHFKQPESVRMQVDVVNAVVAGARRPSPTHPRHHRQSGGDPSGAQRLINQDHAATVTHHASGLDLAVAVLGGP